MIKQAIFRLLPLLPVNVLASLAESKPGSFKYRLATAGLKHRHIEIANGVAKGLKFNNGESSPELGLGTYELPIQSIFAQHLNTGDVFYDIGANVGFFSKQENLQTNYYL